jgi:hypothetical protein
LGHFAAPTQFRAVFERTLNIEHFLLHEETTDFFQVNKILLISILVKDGDCKFFCLVEFVKSFKEDERGGNTFH